MQTSGGEVVMVAVTQTNDDLTVEELRLLIIEEISRTYARALRKFGGRQRKMRSGLTKASGKCIVSRDGQPELASWVADLVAKCPCFQRYGDKCGSECGGTSPYDWRGPQFAPADNQTDIQARCA